MKKIQLNIKEISKPQFNEFLGLLHRDYEPCKVKPADDGHYIVYHYISGKLRFNVCYDMLASCVQVTADEQIVQCVREKMETVMGSSILATQNAICEAVAARDENDLNATGNKQPAKPKKRQGKVIEPQQKQTDKPAEDNNRKDAASSLPSTVNMAPVASVNREYRDGMSSSDMTQSRLREGIEALKTHREVSSVYAEESNVGSPQHIIKYSVADRYGAKATVQYAINRKVLQIQGRPSDLTELIRCIFFEPEVLGGQPLLSAPLKPAGASKNNDKPKEKKVGKKVANNVSAEPPTVKPSKEDQPKTEKKASRIKRDKKAEAEVSNIKKVMGKLMPHGVRYLSVQSQTYLFFAQNDLNSTLSNYSGILGTAYQGLENLISNLQQAQGIKVKLIGQAYEKPEGKYELKAVYAKRVKSVIFCEVMSALYTEYFEKRHFYTHSDNFSDVPRIINDQKTAKAELCRLIEIIEYNCTKLSEIGFVMSDDN